MADDDKMMDELNRLFPLPEERQNDRSADPHQGIDDPPQQEIEELTAEFPHPEDDEPPQYRPQYNEYQQALSDARMATALFERTLATSRARKRALAQLPFPWVRPALRLALWGTGGAVIYLTANPEPDHWQGEIWMTVLFTAQALLYGEGLGRALSRMVRNATFSSNLMGFANALLFALLSAILLTALFTLQPGTLPLWLPFALTGLGAAAALTLPWFGTSQKEYNRIVKTVETADKKQAEARRKASRAVDQLARIHKANLQQIPPGLRNRKKSGFWG